MTKAVLTLPTRIFDLVLDPYCLHELLMPGVRGAIQLVGDLMGFDPPVTFRLVFPGYLATGSQQQLSERGRIPVVLFPDEDQVSAVALSRGIGRRVRERIERGAEGECRGLRLLSLAEHLKADGIVTALPSLVDARYNLLRHHKFRIVLPAELPDFVEICARGLGVPCSSTLARRWLPPDLLYQWAHWKNRRLVEWFSKASPTLPDAGLRERLRSAIYNRYAFILHARDMVHFYQLQKDHYVRRGRQVYWSSLNYHLTAFYVHVWGMLDALAGIANLRLGLGLNPLRCGIDREEFLDALEGSQPGLHRFIKTYRTRWIAIIGDVRHPAAHSALRLQHDIVTHTEESQKSYDEIAAILRREDPTSYELLPDLAKKMEPALVENWRINKMKVITDDAIYVEGAAGGYFRPPVTSLDFDLERLNAFIDAFLFACFKRNGSRPS